MDLLIYLATKAVIFIIFLIALNSLMLGKMNLWAIGNIVYFSLGSFITGFVSNNWGINDNRLYLLFLIVPVAVSIVSLIFFYASRVFKQDFFLFFSLFFIELNFVANKMVAGSSGYSHIIRPSGIQSDLSLLVFSVILLIICIVWINNFDKSRVNKLHSVMRDSEILAFSWGININKSQIPLFIASAILSGLMGVMFAFCTYGADPKLFTTNNMIILFALLILGGIDSIQGAVVAGLIFVFFTYSLESALSSTFQIHAPKITQIVFGILLIVIPFIMPKGLFGKRNFQ
ncbi:branched-chain amino acid ABC transporter permease [Bacteroidia bacterium]|nr:branched-chain amino acid ABC transporter permease [Bacteroidia bacterium]